MRRALIFILFLSFHLLGGYKTSHASAIDSKLFSSVQNSKKKQLKEHFAANQDFLIGIDNGLGLECEHVFSVEDDDEEIIRKYTPTASQLLAFYNAFFCFESCNYHLDRISGFDYLPLPVARIYLEQRVLRI